MSIKKISSLLLTLFISSNLYSQDLLSQLDSVSDQENDFEIATFKTTRLIDQHTIETVGPRTLDFRISHRFGPINSGAYNAWGLDGSATIRLALEYSPNGRLMFGIGRTSLDKTVDGFAKYRLIRQTTNQRIPVGITLFAGSYYTALRDPNILANGYDKYEYASSRLSYCFEVMVARKFSTNFSLQIAPWIVHFNLAEHITDQNDVFGISGLFRMKITKRAALTAEYAYRINNYSPNTKYYDSMSIGYELETGGHVFQIHFTNSAGLVENQFFTHTESKWNNMGIRLGFNISRVFTL